MSGQDTSITLYFKSGQCSLTTSQRSSIERLKIKPVEKITFEGYADTVGKTLFNTNLSYKRAQTCANTIHVQNKTFIGMGERNDKNNSLDKMRRVDVKVWYQQTEIQKLDVTVVSDPCKEDTIIYSETGTAIRMNRCFYEKIRYCFRFDEYRDAKTTQRSGLQTIDENGQPIESGGMFNIQFCFDTFLKTPITVYMPVPPCLKEQKMSLWTLTSSNTWKNSRNNIEIVNIKGKAFYKINIISPGQINCDRPVFANKKMKIKLKTDFRIKAASISYDCPLYSVKGKINNRKKTITFPYSCPNGNPLLFVKAVNKHGDTLVFDNKNINQLKRKQKIKSNCVCEPGEREKFLGLFTIPKKYLYRKYIIYNQDFDLQSQPEYLSHEKNNHRQALQYKLELHEEN